MKTIVSKQEQRNEKKKKKLAALANLVHLNDQDRLKESMEARNEVDVRNDDNLKEEAVELDDDSFITVTHKKKKTKKSKMPPTLGEPDSKRKKVEHDDATEVSSADEELSRMKLTLTPDEYKELRCKLRARKRQLENVPSLRLREFGYKASLEVPQDKRTPIFLTDIQHLLMSTLIGKKSPCTPDRWCFLDKATRISHSVVLILEGLSLYHYLSNESKFQESNKIFDTRLEIVLPPKRDSFIIEEMSQIPLTNAQATQLINEHGSLDAAIEMTKDPTLHVKSIFPIELKSTEGSSGKSVLPPTDKIPRTKLLLSALQMVEENYPMPLRGELNERYKDYVFSKDKYEPVTDHSPMFGIDCEMCRTSIGYNELTRVSIVNEKLETVYETLVRPTYQIIDYLTPYSGITPELMMAVTKTLKDVQREVRNLLPPDAILIGQSLNCDLTAMKMMHPYVIDTSVCFNLTGTRKKKSKLQALALAFLKEAIQKNIDGHDSVEDSVAALKLVQMKLANGLDFGDEILIQKKRFHDILRATNGENITNNLFAHASLRDKRTAIVTAFPLKEQMKELIEKADKTETGDPLKTVSLYELNSNKETIRKARELALEHALTITNIQLSAEQLHYDVAEKTLGKLDKWIRKLWNTMAHNGMFVVLMGGSEECPSGLAKIAIKRNVADVAAEVPITV